MFSFLPVLSVIHRLRFHSLVSSLVILVPANLPLPVTTASPSISTSPPSPDIIPHPSIYFSSLSLSLSFRLDHIHPRWIITWICASRAALYLPLPQSHVPAIYRLFPRFHFSSGCVGSVSRGVRRGVVQSFSLSLVRFRKNSVLVSRWRSESSGWVASHHVLSFMVFHSASLLPPPLSKWSLGECSIRRIRPVAICSPLLNILSSLPFSHAVLDWHVTALVQLTVCSPSHSRCLPRPSAPPLLKLKSSSVFQLHLLHHQHLPDSRESCPALRLRSSSITPSL